MRTEKKVSLGFALASVILGAALAPAIIRGLASSRWPSTAGTIVSAAVIGDTGPDSGWHVNLRYQFIFQNQTYEGWRYDSLGDFGSGRKEDCEQFATAHPIAGTMTVFYNPAAPSDCLLKPGANYRHMIVALIALVLGLVAIGFALGWIKIKKPDDLNDPPGSLLKSI